MPHAWHYNQPLNSDEYLLLEFFGGVYARVLFPIGENLMQIEDGLR
nr:hypothetical protein [Granulicella rosea]